MTTLIVKAPLLKPKHKSCRPVIVLAKKFVGVQHIALEAPAERAA